MPLQGSRNELLRDAIAEMNRRENEALRLFRPMPQQEAIIRCLASEMIVRGGNRAGKSLICAAEVASCATGRPIIGIDGNELAYKYHRDPKLIWTIGLGEDHIGDTIYRLLFQPGAFSVIKDTITGKMRAYNPLDPADKARELERKNAPPFIPEEYIKDCVWENAGAKIFKHIVLKNGTIIKAYPSTGDVKMGDPVDLIWVDEDIRYKEYVAEWLARLSDKKGRLIWSAWPNCKNTALRNMSRRAAAQAKEKRPNPDIQEFLLSFEANVFMDENEKRKRLEAWNAISPTEARARNLGHYVEDDILMYPNFATWVHGMPREDGPPETVLEKTLRLNAYQPPREWTRYVIVDPGHTTTAMLFVAVPTPDIGDYAVVYDELYLHQCDSDRAAQATRDKIAGHQIQAFIIDNRYGRQTISGVGKRFRQIYSESFARYGLKSIETGSEFLPGCDDEPAGIEAVRGWLRIRPDGTCKLHVVLGTTPNFQEEIAEFSKRIVKDEAADKADSGQRDHLMDTLRYAAAHGCAYVPVLAGYDNLPEDPTLKAFNDLMHPKRHDDQRGSFLMGAGSAA